jgi:hypothetical protein
VLSHVIHRPPTACGSRRRHKYVLRRYIELGRYAADNLSRIGKALFSSGDIGDLYDCNNGLRGAGRCRLSTEDDAWSRKTALGEESVGSAGVPRCNAHQADGVAVAASFDDKALEPLRDPMVAYGSDAHVLLLMLHTEDVSNDVMSVGCRVGGHDDIAFSA